jgi:hypothetical protein
VERANARIKDEFGGRAIYVRGAVKVMAHLIFGIVAHLGSVDAMGDLKHLISCLASDESALFRMAFVFITGKPL